MYITADFIRQWNSIICPSGLVHLFSTYSTGASRTRSSMPFYRLTDQLSSSKLDTRLRLVSIKNAESGFHWRSAGQDGDCFIRQRPATEVMYEGNRTAHAPHDVLPAQPRRRGVRKAVECARGLSSAVNLSENSSAVWCKCEEI